MGSQGFPRAERLTGATEYQAVFQRGRRIERPSMLVLWRGAEGPRKAGFAVSRQLRGAARRNRARRRVREAYRTSRQGLPGGVHVVIVARPLAEVRPYRELLREMREALETVAKGSRQVVEG